jgi:hypothetical protein
MAENESFLTAKRAENAKKRPGISDFKNAFDREIHGPRERLGRC